MQVILKLHWNILKLIACPNHISKKCGLACSIIYPEAILSLDFESLQLEKQHSKLVKTQPLFVLSYHGHFIDSAAAFHAGVFECKIVPVFLTNTFILFSKQYLDTTNVNLLRICCAVATSIFAAVDQDSQFCSTLAGPPSSKTCHNSEAFPLLFLWQICVGVLFPAISKMLRDKYVTYYHLY